MGAAGHSLAFLERVGSTGLVVGVDRDREVLAIATELLEGKPAQLVQGDFGAFARGGEELPGAPFDGILADLGVSSLQLDRAERGFSFKRSGPLDMRMDPTSSVSAADWLQEVDVTELTRVIAEYGEERFARRIAQAIDRRRQSAPFETTGELADVVRGAIPAAARRASTIDPATRTFQGIRIAVNGELDALDALLQRFDRWLAPGGRFAVLSYHSLEDRRVKQAFKERVLEGDYEALTRKAVRPTPEEIARNPRARSARLRVVKRRGGNR